MEIASTLIRLEETFWEAAGDRVRYEENLAPDALHVLPGWGVAEREPVLDAVAAAAPWSSYAIEAPRVLPLGADAAALVYTARALRTGQPPYLAAITSIYRRCGDRWQLAVHQQTPLSP